MSARGRPGSTSARLVAEVVLWAAACFGVWMLTLSSMNKQDITAAGFAAVPCGVLAVLARRVIKGSWRFEFSPVVGETSGDEEEPETQQRATLHVRLIMGAPAVALLSGSLLIGVLPNVHRAIGSAATTFMDGPGYVAAALHLPQAAGAGEVPTGWTAEGILLGLISTAVAVLGAGLAISGEGKRGWHHRIPAPIMSVRAPAQTALAGLRALHSGHIGDYVAWLVLGVVALTALVGVPLA